MVLELAPRCVLQAVRDVVSIIGVVHVLVSRVVLLRSYAVGLSAL